MPANKRDLPIKTRRSCDHPSSNFPYWFSATASNITPAYHEWRCSCATPRPVTTTYILMKMICLRAAFIINENLGEGISTLFSVYSRHPIPVTLPYHKHHTSPLITTLTQYALSSTHYIRHYSLEGYVAEAGQACPLL